MDLPLNPDYGKGQLRRHIAIHHVDESNLVAALEDDCHAFELSLCHDGLKVVDIEAKWHRHPNTNCPGAMGELKKLIGCPLSESVLAHREYQKAVLHCTHFFHLAGLLIAYAWRQSNLVTKSEDVLYCAVVEDEVNGHCSATLTRNDQQVLQWKLKDGLIQAPTTYQGVPALKGLTAWAAENLSLQDLEYAVVLQMALFVSVARRYKSNSAAGINPLSAGMTAGVCYATQESRDEEPVSLAVQRNYSDTPEQMLRFLEIES